MATCAHSWCKRQTLNPGWKYCTYHNGRSKKKKELTNIKSVSVTGKTVENIDESDSVRNIRPETEEKIKAAIKKHQKDQKLMLNGKTLKDKHSKILVCECGEKFLEPLGCIFCQRKKLINGSFITHDTKEISS